MRQLRLLWIVYTLDSALQCRCRRHATTIVPHDPKDDAVVLTAITGHADVIRTLDAPLHEPDVKAFCLQHGIRVLTEIELLAELRTV